MYQGAQNQSALRVVLLIIYIETILVWERILIASVSFEKAFLNNSVWQIGVGSACWF